MKSPILASLHGHSRASDGLHTPTQLIKAAQKASLTYLALTDHDNVDGILELYQAAAQTDHQVLPIAGIELATQEGEVLILKPAPRDQINDFLTWCRHQIAHVPTAHDAITQSIDLHQTLCIIPHPDLTVAGMPGMPNTSLQSLIQNLPTKYHPNLGIEIHNWSAGIFLGKNNQRENHAIEFATKHNLAPITATDYHTTWQVAALSIEIPQTSKPTYQHLISSFQNRQITSHLALPISPLVYLKLFRDMFRVTLRYHFIPGTKYKK